MSRLEFLKEPQLKMNPTATRMGHSEHAVQFYKSADVLISSVGEFILSGLRSGEGVVIIARAKNLLLLRNYLCERNSSISDLEASGQLLLLDAHRILSLLLHDGVPDRTKFQQVVGQTIADLTLKYSMVRAYGEMVDILWAQRDLPATLALESLWNELAQTQTFSLLCGYSIENFRSVIDGKALKDVCECHSKVIPEEEFTSLSDNQAQLRLITELQQRSVALQTEVAERRSIEAQLRQTQSALQVAKDAAEAANHAKTRFLANMSHEIRTPLGAMLGFADLMLEPNQTASERLQCIETVIRNGKHLTRIIDEILDVSKIESERLEIEKLRFSLSELVSEITSLMGLQAREKGLELQCRIETDLPASIESGLTRLRQILVNVIGNAIKFTKRGVVELIIRTRTWNDSVVIEFVVTDSGIGMNSDQAARLFDPFVQADSSTTRKFGGTGLGLYISKRLARALGGDVNLIKSAPDQGSTFVVNIDGGSYEKSKKAALISVDTGRLICNFEEKRFLLVDDSEDNRLFIGRMLQKLGAQVDLAVDGKKGLEMALNQNYDAILLDIQMPQMDGFEVVKNLRASGNKGPVIALTAHVMKTDQEQCLISGFNAHIGKPIDRDKLTEVLRDFVGR